MLNMTVAKLLALVVVLTIVAVANGLHSRFRLSNDTYCIAGR